MGLDVSLSPGELERYQRETDRKLRCERLKQVRQREDAITRTARQEYERRRLQEERALQAAEVRAELESKRARLAGLLEEKAICEAARGGAARAAELHARQARADEARAVAVEARRKEQEALRSLEALRHCREGRLAAERQVSEARERRLQVHSAEERRARRAADLGRDVAAAKERAAQATQQQASEAAKWGPKQVLRVDSAWGVEQYAKTYYHVIQHGEGASNGEKDDACLIEAEFDRPLSPPPRPSPLQLQKAADRGRAAESGLATTKKQLEAERQLAQEVALKRQEKVQQTASAGRPRSGSPRWTAELLPWRVESASKTARAEMDEILAQSGIPSPAAGLKAWEPIAQAAVQGKACKRRKGSSTGAANKAELQPTTTSPGTGTQKPAGRILACFTEPVPRVLPDASSLRRTDSNSFTAGRGADQEREEEEEEEEEQGEEEEEEEEMTQDDEVDEDEEEEEEDEEDDLEEEEEEEDEEEDEQLETHGGLVISHDAFSFSPGREERNPQVSRRDFSAKPMASREMDLRNRFGAEAQAACFALAPGTRAAGAHLADNLATGGDATGLNNSLDLSMTEDDLTGSPQASLTPQRLGRGHGESVPRGSPDDHPWADWTSFPLSAAAAPPSLPRLGHSPPAQSAEELLMAGLLSQAEELLQITTSEAALLLGEESAAGPSQGTRWQSRSHPQPLSASSSRGCFPTGASSSGNAGFAATDRTVGSGVERLREPATAARPPAPPPVRSRWAADDLEARLEEICKELDDVVGFGEPGG
ncbi:unnamed protein product [Polarella glacialis]|uniref:Uncharacterized protein n=1 Tax=Polarella glacialis TaxID=89957 RepID=A0A813GI50_POLGL|nr:unnamed protein product [Polarella glacialis]